MGNEWTKASHAESYLERKLQIPHRAEGEATLLSELPETARRVLDLGCGDGHLLSLVLANRAQAQGVGLDFSPTMLARARATCGADSRFRFVLHNLDEPLPKLGQFDAVVSSFAIHHCSDARKRALYAEVWQLLVPGGIFCNLEHVASPTAAIHARFLAELGIAPEDEDPSNQLLDVETQLCWLREIGYDDVDCHWKWRELALLAGCKPSPDAISAQEA